MIDFVFVKIISTPKAVSICSTQERADNIIKYELVIESPLVLEPIRDDVGVFGMKNREFNKLNRWSESATRLT